MTDLPETVSVGSVWPTAPPDALNATADVLRKRPSGMRHAEQPSHALRWSVKVFQREVGFGHAFRKERACMCLDARALRFRRARARARMTS
jgi:hypothetical protein